MTSMKVLATILFYFYAFFSLLTICYAVDTISANQTIRDGDTIVSASEYFELGFFTVGNSSQNLYLGIRYRLLAAGTVIWIANKETPITNTSAVLQLGRDGVLQLRNGSNGLVWSSSNSSRTARNAVARLLDTGNLVIRDESDTNPESYIWQSFDHPGDTFMPAMKLGRDLVRGIERNFVSWRSADDPSPGEYSIYMDFNGYPQVFERRGTEILYRLGSWNGLRFTGMIGLSPNPIFTFEFVFNQEEIYYRFDLINSSVLTKMQLGVNGNVDRLNWNDRTQNWFLYSTPITDSCVRYALCGAFGSCSIDASPPCGCLEGFEPINRDQWMISDWNSGCKRRVALDCGSSEGFRKYEGLKLPDTRNSWFNHTMSLDECEMRCKSNCSCTAYSTLDISGEGSGCLLWFGELIDMISFPEKGQDIYIRMAPSELAKDRRSSRKQTVRTIVIRIMATLTVILGLCLLCAFRRRNRKGRVKLEQELQDTKQDYSYESQKNELDLPLFSFSTLLNATNHFSLDNKLGEGGYGPVYKGMLSTGQEIAVKRLSKNSGQGVEEFKNEIILISRLQHRNLVRLLGYCLQGEEMILIYEYMPNKSLNYFIFDQDRISLLTWKIRFEIAMGIAKGLLYLHQDSRLRIIHRDLKASNVLLDRELNPKISDFGIARTFLGDQIESKTRHVIGTYGYMSPEYAIDGKFSAKSDVFSFGVLLLEIVSGKRNSGFHHEEHHHSLLGHAWLLWDKGEALDIVDSCFKDSCVESQAIRCIQVGLLCVQKFPADRPTMSSVVMMLGSEDVMLHQPKHPGFFIERSSIETYVESSEGDCQYENGMTITILEAR